MGRPKFPINMKQLLKLAEMQCSNEEMANFFGCSVDTIERRFAESKSLRRAYAKGNISLRRAQYRSAVKHRNVRMLIFLGKVRLGQSDKDPGLR